MPHEMIMEQEITMAYQQAAARTLRPTGTIEGHNADVLHVAVGLAGEAGEILELAKKVVFHGHAIDKARWANELGDVLWYLAATCTTLELDMAEVMAQNIEKLLTRYPGGYSDADSVRRVDVP